MAPFPDELVDAPVIDAVLAGELGYRGSAVVAGYHCIHLSLAQTIMKPPDPLSAR